MLNYVQRLLLEDEQKNNSPWKKDFFLKVASTIHYIIPFMTDTDVLSL